MRQIILNNQSINHSVSECLVIQYADDTQLLLTGDVDNIAQLIARAENLLSTVRTYFQNNGLLLNEKKTQCLFIGSRHIISNLPDDITINFNGNSIKPNTVVKNLGLYMDQYMLFNVHIDEMHRKVIGTLLYLNRIADCFEKSTRIVVVQSLVLSIINYCSRVWGVTNTTQIKRVQKLQNFAAKVAVGGLRKYDHVSPAFKELEWLRIENQCFYDMCIFVFKILNNQFPEFLFDVLTVREVRGMMTRQSNDLYVPRTNTVTGAKMLTVRGPQIWNEIPRDIRNTGSLYSFKNKLKKYLFYKQSESY